MSTAVGSAVATGATMLAASVAITADAVAASGTGVSVVAEAVLLIEICASSGACSVTAEPFWLPLDSAAVAGASVIAEEIVRDDASVSGAVASGAAGVSMSVATAVTVAVRSGPDSSIVVSVPGVSLVLAAIDAVRLALNDLRGCNATVAAGAGVVADVQPSSLPVVGVVVSLDGATEPVSSLAGDGAGLASACTSLAAPGIDGSIGSVPIESSYVGRFAVSCLGWRGAGRVTYSLVTTGTV